MQWQRDGYTISDRPELLDRDTIHGFLCESYWSPGVPRAVVDACLRRWMLATRDAHGLYAQNGFGALRNPERFMEINDPGIYTRQIGL